MKLQSEFNIALLAINGNYDEALNQIKDNVDLDNIDKVLEEYNTFIDNYHENGINKEVCVQIREVLEEIKSDILINLFIDKDPYIKILSDDKIINLTGQSGSGKSTYAKNNFNSDDYIIIDTDDIFSDERFKQAKDINKELGEYFRNKYNPLPNCGDDFDLIYNEILEYCKDINKTIVIDCAQFHCIKDITLLKGKLIIIRTSINNCYNRTIKRYKSLYPGYSDEELSKYKERKKSIFKWYKYSNDFIIKINNI